MYRPRIHLHPEPKQRKRILRFLRRRGVALRVGRLKFSLGELSLEALEAVALDELRQFKAERETRARQRAQIALIRIPHIKLEALIGDAA